MNYPKYQLFKSAINQEYYYHLRAENGEPILIGEGYTTKQSCLNGIQSVKTNARLDSQYVRRDSLGNYTFNLEAANGEIIGRSESYTTRTQRDNGIDAVKRDAPGAPIDDVSDSF
jgi:hypothetical protein